jgi:hypothetical protein
MGCIVQIIYVESTCILLFTYRTLPTDMLDSKHVRRRLQEFRVCSYKGFWKSKVTKISREGSHEFVRSSVPSAHRNLTTGKVQGTISFVFVSLSHYSNEILYTLVLTWCQCHQLNFANSETYLAWLLERSKNSRDITTITPLWGSNPRL